ncbi:MAG: hypothetical protein QMC40_08260 [Vicingaceae bacterium]|jgi:hypothetical protein|tara:strand:- start:2147 stop:2545 length:399 start_codon:yes stop_codon:yes gene_type:complete
MIKLSSIVLSFVVLFQGFGITANDFVQFDEFIEHAQFHSEEHGDNFLVFVSKHYGDLKEEHGEKHQDEKKEHEELPFQHQSKTACSAAFILASNETDVKAPEPFGISSIHFFYNALLSSTFLEGILQPPRIS